MMNSTRLSAEEALRWAVDCDDDGRHRTAAHLRAGAAAMRERDAMAKALDAIVMRLLHTTDAGAADAAQIACDALAAVRAKPETTPPPG